MAGRKPAPSTVRGRTGPRFIDYPRWNKRGIVRWLPSWKLITGLFATGVLALVGLFCLGYYLAEVPDPAELAEAETSVVYWADGQTEMGRFSVQDRESVDIDQIPEHLRDAVIAAEDRSFYENRGVSPRGVARAFVNNVRGGDTQGGSTITQQYVERYFLESATTLRSKVNEAFISLKVDQQLTKDQILEDYLNTIYFGRGAYGVQTASQEYFGKDVSELTVAESALLAGIIPAPSAYDPAVAPEKTQARWNYVVGAMTETGALTVAERQALVFPPTIAVQANRTYAGPNGHLLAAVRAEAVRVAGVEEEELDAGGLRIVSTFDLQVQQAMYDAIADELPTDGAEGVEAGMVAIRPGDGAVAAMYGGADYQARQRNNATQDIAQAGSVFKPFTLAAALSEGVSLNSRYDGDSPQQFPGFTEPVRNFGGDSFGQVDLREATADSINTAYVELNLEIGPQATVDAAVAAGLPKDTAGLTAEGGNVLGVSSPHVIDIAEAYSTFAAQGEHTDPYVIASVTRSDGAPAYQKSVTPQRVFEADVMADLTDALVGVVEDGSGRTARELDRPVAGKTGTSSDNLSAWFAGYTPQLATVVGLYRIGEDGNPDSLNGLGGRENVTGGSFPVQIWTAFMDSALEGEPVAQFPEPAGVGERREPEQTRPEPERDRPREDRDEPTETEPETQPETIVPSLPTEPTQAPEPTQVEPTEEPTAEPPPADPDPGQAPPDPDQGDEGDQAPEDQGPQNAPRGQDGRLQDELDQVLQGPDEGRG